MTYTILSFLLQRLLLYLFQIIIVFRFFQILQHFQLFQISQTMEWMV